jgi:hypothetical protein
MATEGDHGYGYRGMVYGGLTPYQRAGLRKKRGAA